MCAFAKPDGLSSTSKQLCLWNAKCTCNLPMNADLDGRAAYLDEVVVFS